MAFELFLGKLGEFVFSKAAKKTADKAFGDLSNIKEFDLILKTLQKNLKSLSAKAADVEEEIKNGEASGRKKRKRQVEEWFGEVKSIKIEVGELESQVESGGFIMRLTDGGKATRLNEQVEKLIQQSVNFGDLLLDVCGTRGEILLTSGMVGEAVNKDLEEILKLLENRQVSKIGVYGMGGVGKTTLAKYIHNRLLKQSQGRVFWITVSQEFTIRSLQDKIARCLGVDLSVEDEEALRAGRLNRFLSQMKNSVLILDDVWERIDMLKVGCTFSVEFCRLIITTRSLEVCHRIDCEKVIPVVKLRKDEAWKLFTETLGNGIEVGSQVEAIAKSMAKVCDGLPLGIITVAGSMKGETGTHKWRSALVELKDCVGGGKDEMGEVDEVFKVLKYSFDRLNRNYRSESNELNRFQLCFMYCSLYPEDYPIGREHLVRKFISEGLVDERKSRRAQVDQGHSILDKLVNLCLLESCIDYENSECVKMHDLVRSMALKISEGKYTVKAGDLSLKEICVLEEAEWSKDAEKVSFMKCKHIRRIEDGMSPNCPSLSTLLLWGNYRLKVIPDSFFSKIQGLCTLDLCGNVDIAMLPDSIRDLTRLKSLLLECCRKLKKVPYLGKMKSLRELNLSGTAIKEAPQGLEELLNLRFLSMNAHGLKMLPRGVLLKLGHLQHLNLPFHVQVEIEELKALKQLEEFGGGVENVSDFNWLVTTHADDPCYKIRVNSNINFAHAEFRTVEKWELDMNELVLCGFNLNDGKVLGKGIVYLRIWRCEGLSKWFADDLSERFDNPTCLKKLKMSNCRGIEWILRSDSQASQITDTLEHIELRSLDDLKGVVMMQRREIRPSTAPAQLLVFSSLKGLTIYKCSKIWKAGLPALGVTNLERIDIRDCEGVEEIFEQDGEGIAAATAAAASTSVLPKLKELVLWDLPRLRKVGLPALELPSLEYVHISSCGEIEQIFEQDEDEDEGRAAASTLTTILPKLKHLNLSHLPRLKRVSKATIVSNSIQTISITKCPELMKKLPLHFGDPTPPPSLRWIVVEREWWESLGWENTNIPLLLQDFLEFL